MSSLTPGIKLGPYEVLDPIGAGGMGEVYRASDSRLKRQVALKVLPPGVTDDPDRMARFQREAEVLASLNHPNIAALYGMEVSGDVQALVMELVEGPTLADRIAQGPLPIGEALAIARQIAHALAAAHDQGIIHRDLKPANIKVRHDGDVKVLDFGLAKAMEPASAPGAGLSMSPTITSPAQMTAAGMILGTAAYMSPEQAAGRAVDRRTDLWAFGVVLLEMLSGKRVFDGETVSHVIASVLKDDPDWTTLPADTPAGVRKLLRRCLEKDRRKRLSDAATAAFECEDALQPVQDESPARPLPSSPSWRWWPAMAGLAAGALIAGLGAWRAWPSAPAAARSIRFSIDLPADLSLTRVGRHVIALSPDGTHLAFVANQQLYLRPLRALEAVPIPGTAKADPSQPVFSPDGQWIAFWSDGRLKKIPVTGGTPMTLASIRNPYGIAWNGERIVFGEEYPRSIVEVPANGGPLTTLLAVDAAKDEWVQSPQLLKDGRAVLFTLRTGDGDWNDSAIVMQDLATNERTTLVQGGTDGRGLPGGWLAYGRGGTLFVVRFDEERRAVSGSAVPLEVGVLQSVGGFTGASQAAWSSSGTLAIVPDYTFGADRSLAWMTRQGAIQPTPLPPRPLWAGSPSVALSPDSRYVAARTMGSSRTESDIWIGDLSRNTFARLTVSGSATDPVWMPDGTRVCYESADTVFCQPFDGSGPPESLFQRTGLSTISAISPDGASLVLTMNGESSLDLWRAPNKPPYEATPLIVTATIDEAPAVSPDGRWIAYESEESGQEVYVRPFPAVGQGRWKVSDAGGIFPRWSRDGREIYYMGTGTGGSNLIYSLVAVPVMPGPSFTLGKPATIARLPTGALLHDVSRDGRLLVSMPTISAAAGGTGQRIVVVHNWPDAVP